LLDRLFAKKIRQLAKRRIKSRSRSRGDRLRSETPDSGARRPLLLSVPGNPILNELLTQRMRFKNLAVLACRPSVIRSVAMKIVQIALFAVFLSLANNAFAQQSDNSDYPDSITREQWKARIDAAKARVREMRREGKSFIAPPEQNSLLRILEDSTLVFGDIVTTERGTFQFIGGTVVPHNPEDFRQVAPDRVFPQR
jgi:hypothetical protein